MKTFEEQWRHAQADGCAELNMLNSILDLKADRYEMQNKILDQLLDLRRYLDVEELNFRRRIERTLDNIEELVNANQIP